MSERASGRHRASHKSTSSSISTLTGPLSVVGEYVGSVRRSGVIIAMSSGLVASMALPAHAVTSGPAEVSGPATASMPAAPAGGSSAFFAAPSSGLLSLPAGVALEDGTVSAPASATLDFDHTAFVAVPSADGVSVHQVSTVDVGLPGAGTGSTTTGDQADQTPPPPTTRREARTGTAAAAPSSGWSTSSAPTVAAPASGIGAAAVAIGSRYLGTPYRFGGTTPSGFDCSGFVQYVFNQLGVHLPRTAAEQADAVRHISRSQARPGDLVLFPGGGHIAIYLGGNMMMDAPHTGSSVGIRQIYTAAVSFGRAA